MGSECTVAWIRGLRLVLSLLNFTLDERFDVIHMTYFTALSEKVYWVALRCCSISGCVIAWQRWWLIPYIMSIQFLRLRIQCCVWEMVSRGQKWAPWSSPRLNESWHEESIVASKNVSRWAMNASIPGAANKWLDNVATSPETHR